MAIPVRWLFIAHLLFATSFAFADEKPREAFPAAPFTAPRYSSHSQLMLYRDDKGVERPVQSPADWKIRRQHILAAMQEVMGPLPDIRKFPPLDLKVKETFQGENYKRLTISFATEERDRVPAYLYIPDHIPVGKKLAAIVALHPTGELGKKITDGEGSLPGRGYARELAQRGYVVIAPDYPSFGDLKDYSFVSDNYASATMKAITNHRRCIDLLSARPEVDPQRIGAIGHSLGGHNSMFLAAFDERVKATVSSCGWTPFREYYGYYGGKLSGWAQDKYMPRIKYVYDSEFDRMPFDFYEVVAAMAPRAFLTVSPINDHNFDIAGVRKTMPQAQKVYNLLGAPANLQGLYPTCRHDFPDAARRAAYEFFDKHLQHTSTKNVP